MPCFPGRLCHPIHPLPRSPPCGQVTEAISLLSRLHAVRRRHVFVDASSVFFRQQLTFCGQDDPGATDVFDRALRENRGVGGSRGGGGCWAREVV